MKRVKDVFGELRALADVAHEIYVSNDPYDKFTSEYSAANKLARDFQASIAPELVVSLRKAQEWIREKHSVVYCGSNWTNCFGMMMLIIKPTFYLYNDDQRLFKFLSKNFIN